MNQDTVLTQQGNAFVNFPQTYAGLERVTVAEPLVIASANNLLALSAIPCRGGRRAHVRFNFAVAANPRDEFLEPFDCFHIGELLAGNADSPSRPNLKPRASPAMHWQLLYIDDSISAVPTPPKRIRIGSDELLSGDPSAAAS